MSTVTPDRPIQGNGQEERKATAAQGRTLRAYVLAAPMDTDGAEVVRAWRRGEIPAEWGAEP